MSQRRATRAARCIHCRINHRWCFCDKISKKKNQTKLSIIMHHREMHLTSSTVNLAKLMLENIQIHFRGKQNLPLEYKPNPNKKSYYLFPTESAVEISELRDLNPSEIELIIPDGTWRQAKKIHKREPVFKDIQFVKLTDKNLSEYTLRTQSTPEHLCTIEAIAYALGELESKQLQEHLLTGLRIMNERFEHSRNPELWQNEYKY